MFLALVTEQQPAFNGAVKLHQVSWTFFLEWDRKIFQQFPTFPKTENRSMGKYQSNSWPTGF